MYPTASRTLVLLLPLTVAACGPAVSIGEEDARAVLEPALAGVANPDRVGLHLKGKAVWLQAPFFDKSCLENKDLAFNDDPATRPGGGGGTARISPTYAAQRYLTASTDSGYCVYAGKGLSTEITAAEFDWGTQDRWRFTVKYTMAEPTPWFDCLADDVKERTIIVRQGQEGEPAAVLESDVALVEDGGCPAPLPGGEERTGYARPTARPKAAPSKADVSAALKRLDDALWEGDFAAVLDSMVCYNLFEENKVGTCSIGEVIALGPVPRGEPRMKDGTPWLEYVADRYDDFGAIKKDPKDPTLYHVSYTHKRTNRTRSVSVQWADGQWKVVGVVVQKAEGITTARILTDLQDRDKKTIFDRRLAGEMIDEQGDWLPGFEPREEGE
ncbi:MAG: hypothetical protein H6742_20705 [Alphaproteobacteria bacterium]|nr:hypothetical protein [Alphaproteobacteria bacterium]